MNSLSEDKLDPCPFRQFAKWYAEAEQCEKIRFPDAMTLSCLDPSGYPDARTVLLKSHSPDGFVFFSNLLSHKGRSLGFLPRAALLFYWEPLDRQVRMKGDVSIVSTAESDAYFRSRARNSQIGAWASKQSQALGSRKELEDRVAYYEEKFQGREVPRPPYWLGFRLRPHRFQFWLQREFRLHDCFSYELASGNEKTGKPQQWVIKRRYP